MNKVITINLGGQAYQLEEAGYALLQSYLKEASAKLDSDPDKDEIINDLEQAIAEKFNRLFNGGKNVVTAKEAEAVIEEMGPVEGNAKKAGETENGSKENLKGKRLFRIKEGKVIAGVCTGLAAYFEIDVVIIRIIFVLLGLLTHGIMILVYIVMMIVIPKADSSAKLAAAYGDPLTAQELIRRAREEFAEFSDKGEWKKWKYEMKQKYRQQRSEWRASERYPSGSGFFGLVILAFIIFWLAGLALIITKGMLFGFVLPLSWPLWVVVLAWIFIFMIIIDPLSRVQKGVVVSSRCPRSPFSGIFSLAFLLLCAWLIWHFVPESHVYFHKGYELFERAVSAVKNG